MRWPDKVPVVGYTLYRGWCLDCHEPISPRCVVVEALTALFFLGLWMHPGEGGGLMYDIAVPTLIAGQGMWTWYMGFFP